MTPDTHLHPEGAYLLIDVDAHEFFITADDCGTSQVGFQDDCGMARWNENVIGFYTEETTGTNRQLVVSVDPDGAPVTPTSGQRITVYIQEVGTDTWTSITPSYDPTNEQYTGSWDTSTHGNILDIANEYRVIIRDTSDGVITVVVTTGLDTVPPNDRYEFSPGGGRFIKFSIGDAGEMNVQSDWDEGSVISDAYIHNKPEFGDGDPARTSDASASGSSDDLARFDHSHGTWNIRTGDTLAHHVSGRPRYIHLHRGQ